MPGMSFICDLTGDLTQKGSEVLESLDAVIHAEQYERTVLLNEKPCFLGSMKYKSYPLTIIENSEFLIFLEGKIYNAEHSAISTQLNNLAEIIFQTRLEERMQISRWLLDTDGDFIIVALHKTSRDVAIINDALGRLPFYYHRTKGLLVASRDLRFVYSLLKNRKFDTMAIAQNLLFGYPLGKRTLMENIYRLDPATLIKINISDNNIRMENIYRFNFDIKKHIQKNIESNARELTLLFSEACKNRVNSYAQNLVSLSGGLDSRSVAACLHKNEIPFYGVTYLDSKRKTELDVKIAKKLASILNIDSKIFHLPNPKGKDLLGLLKMKNGLNWLGMSFYLVFFDKIMKQYGSRGNHFFTGDGGAKLRDLRPHKNLKDLDGLVNYIILENEMFSLEEVVSLTGIEKSKIIDEIKSQVLSYPERDWNQKYMHFLIFERGFKWNFEGEDRNRFCFWSVAPFYSIKFFDYVMNCPDKQKARYKLYRDFLLNLSPQVSSINNANWNLSITSRRYKIQSYLVSSIFRHLPSTFSKKNFKNLLKKKDCYKNGSTIMNCLRAQLNDCHYIYEYLSYPALNNVVQRCSEYSKLKIEMLFTITSSIEEIECAQSTLEKYYESDFV